MLKYVDYDIVFQEIPDQTTLAINLSCCPCHCEGCHSMHLWRDIGEPFDEKALDELLLKYGNAITCVSLMGGDNDPEAVQRMATYIKSRGKHSAWYSGRQQLPQGILIDAFDFVKVGPYIKYFGGLDKPTTNQRLYKVENGDLIDITSRMQRKI